MKTLLMLQVEFDGRAEVPVAEIAERYLGIASKKALDLAKVQKLPFPVHRLGSQKSPWLVHLADLAAYIDQRREEARTDWERMNAA